MQPPAPRRSVGGGGLDIERRAIRERLDVFLASRDAGNALTRDALHQGVTLRTIIDVAERLAVYADEAQMVVKDEYRPRLHCRDACSYCCSKPNVLVSVPELVRLLDHIERTFGADAVT